jgi:hypothetical protein
MPEKTFRVQWQYVEVPRICRVRVIGVSLDRRETGAVSRAMNVSPVLNLDGLLEVRNQTPKLLFHILLGDRSMTLEDRVVWHLALEVALLEIGSLLLKLSQRVEPALFESELTIPDEASRAIPLMFRFCLQGRVQTCPVI